MELHTRLVYCTLLLCCFPLVLSISKTSDSKTPSSVETTSKAPETTVTHNTPQTTTEPKPIMAIPKFDFSKLTDNPLPDQNSGISATPAKDILHSNNAAPTDSCSTDMCKIMKGICNNNGRCKPQVCQSDIICECDPGYTGQFCDTNMTEVILANDVPMLNGKIVSTEAPRVKNGKHSGNGKIAATELPSGTNTNGKELVSGNSNDTHITDTARGTAGNTDVVVGNEGTGKDSNGTNSQSSVKTNGKGKAGKVNKNEGPSKYTQPKGSFLKGPEVPTPTASNPIKVNVKRQKIKEKSTAIIQHFTDSVTISTVSVKLKQSVTLDASGLTMKNDKLSGKQTSEQRKKTSKQTPSTGQQTSGQPKQTTKQSKKEQNNNKVGTTMNSELKQAKNVERVVLTNGKVHLVDQKVKPVDLKPQG